MAPQFELKITDSLNDIPATAWNALAGDDPFLRYEFLAAMHETGCASKETGWLPQFVTLWEGSVLRGAMPLYLKNHSYGEYVFDWTWANAYQRSGYAYYPKLLSAIPFSPVTGRRLMAENAAHRALLITAVLKLAKDRNAESGVSSFHCLFPPEQEALEMERAGMTLRQGIQFHWSNRANGGYESFDAFLKEMSHDKRKKIRQERSRVRVAGVHFQWLSGREVTNEHWRFFAGCYNKTYREHGSLPYLNLEFFARLGRSMPENVLLILALREGRPVAAALNLHSARVLYGRYWGAAEFVPGLHFETCYYQAIEYCIENGITLFEGGAQGEHKLARGFLPVRTWSAHWLAQPVFAAAVGRYLEGEAQDVDRYLNKLNGNSPFRKEFRE
ncbi:MAG: N-acetyltransferase [Nitrosospira sp.]|nr:N-acetyltransferase [Nitrosospira sp.]